MESISSGCQYNTVLVNKLWKSRNVCWPKLETLLPMSMILQFCMLRQ